MCSHSRFDFAILESACNQYGVAMARNITDQVDSLPILRNALGRAKAPLQALVGEFLPNSNLQGEFNKAGYTATQVACRWAAAVI